MNTQQILKRLDLLEYQATQIQTNVTSLRNLLKECESSPSPTKGVKLNREQTLAIVRKVRGIK